MSRIKTELVRILLEGQIRGGKNHIGVTRAGHRYPNPMFEAWSNRALWEIRGQVRGRPMIDYPVRVEVRYWPGDKRRRDVPALIDGLLHVLEKSQILADDYFAQDFKFKTETPRKKAGAEVRIFRKGT